jgi:hypothetical protein
MFAQSNNSRFTAHFTACRRAFCLWLFVQAQIFLVCGCAVIPKPPSQIPAFAPGDEKSMSVPRISGRYADKGEAFTDKGKSVGQVSLSRLLFGDHSAFAGADTVTVVEPEPDMIKIEVFEQGQSVEKHRFSKYTWDRATGGRGIFANWDSSKLGQPYYGEKGFLDIGISESTGGAAGIGLWVAGTECLLRKAIDGSLIVLQRESSFAIFVIVPVWGSHCTWYRFPPIEDGGQP